MTPPLKHTWVTALFLSGLALVLFYAGFLFQKEANSLDLKNQHQQSLLKRLKMTPSPVQFISFLDEDAYKINQEELLTRTAKTHYISLEKLDTSRDQEGQKNIEVTFLAELDTDVFHYIQRLTEHCKSVLALKELGIFRGETGLMGKMTFKVFNAHNDGTGTSNE